MCIVCTAFWMSGVHTYNVWCFLLAFQIIQTVVSQSLRNQLEWWELASLSRLCGVMSSECSSGQHREVHGVLCACSTGHCCCSPSPGLPRNTAARSRLCLYCSAWETICIFGMDCETEAGKKGAVSQDESFNWNLKQSRSSWYCSYMDCWSESWGEIQ